MQSQRSKYTQIKNSFERENRKKANGAHEKVLTFNSVQKQKSLNICPVLPIKTHSLFRERERESSCSQTQRERQRERK